ncbi:hypothetical protein [Glycomyces buryatensis]|uniref:Uncharacterized protein n=1 Tax=Glycomyces buryatensis TaxID=2570927 RepID=A0A4S8QJJ6_9ACTN|nr:hypothetical protein [Glycomyces buryatensis]THV41559.1 hypothetical protein FAB82_10645 [Glycomyces buryatensis]
MSRKKSLAVSAVVAAVVLALALAVPLLNKAVAPTVDVGGETFTLFEVTITAPAEVHMRPGYYQPESGRVEFLVGDAEVAIAVAEPYEFDADYLAAEMARLLEVQPGVQLTDSRPCTASGVAGSGRSFVTETGAGFACAFVHDQVRAEVTATGAALDESTVDRIDALIDGIAFGEA